MQFRFSYKYYTIYYQKMGKWRISYTAPKQPSPSLLSAKKVLSIIIWKITSTQSIITNQIFCDYNAFLWQWA